MSLAAFLLEALLLRHLQWLDARVASYFAVLRGCDLATGVAALTQASGPVAVGVALLALVAGVRRRARPSDIGWTGAVLAVGLLLGLALKLVFARARPWTPEWDSVGDSFPSGHVMHAALFLGAAVSVLPRRPAGRDVLRAGLIASGATFVVGVLLTRLYLGRHWPTDVVGSLLLGLAVVALMPVRQPVARRVTLVIGGLVLSGLFLAAASGGRIRLSSPSSPVSHPVFRVELRRPWPRARVGLGGTWVARRGDDPGYLRVASPEVRLVAELPRQERAVLRIVGRGLRGLGRARCASLELVVDRAPVAALPLSRKWRVYAFALPPLPAGRHELRLRVAPPGMTIADVPTLALRGLQVEQLG